MAAIVSVRVNQGYVPLRWCPQDVSLALNSNDGVTLIDPQSSDVRVLGDHGPVHEIAWSADAAWLALSAEDGGFQGARVISATHGGVRWSRELRTPRIDDLAWSPDGRALACASADEVVVCSSESGDEWFRESFMADQMTWSPCARWLLLQGRVCASTSEYLVLDGQSGRTAKHGGIAEQDHVGWTTRGDEVFREDGARVGHVRSTIVVPFRKSIVYSSDGGLAAAEGSEHTLWIERGSGPLSVLGHPRTIEALAWSPRGDLATACRDGNLRVVRRASDALEPLWHAPNGVSVRAVEWSADGAWIAARTTSDVYVVAALPSTSALPAS